MRPVVHHTTPDTVARPRRRTPSVLSPPDAKPRFGGSEGLEQLLARLDTDVAAADAFNAEHRNGWSADDVSARLTAAAAIPPDSLRRAGSIERSSSPDLVVDEAAFMSEWP